MIPILSATVVTSIKNPLYSTQYLSSASSYYRILFGIFITLKLLIYLPRTRGLTTSQVEKLEQSSGK